MHTKLATAAVLAAALGAIGAGPASSAVTGKCFAKMTKVQGHSAVANCGEATATLLYKGRTYHFKNGQCTKSAGGSSAITLDLGTNVLTDDNTGVPHFSLTMLPAQGEIVASSGAVTITGSARLSSHGTNGTFKGSNTVVKGPKISEVPMSGSWHCGKIYPF